MPTHTAGSLAELFPFPLDEFQLEAIRMLDQGHSVLVSAPTGSGKTVIAEYAIHLALAYGRRVFYTTPLKALSNQKYRDLTDMLGEGKVGLLTGDVSFNRDAPVVVMTTEVYRNMLYGTTLGSVESNLANVQFVILDEVHYMNDAQRGTVWEESIIYSPPGIQLVALSATVANADEMAAWMNRVQGDTTLITSDHRPVPLRFHYFDGRKIRPLMRADSTQDRRARLPGATQRRLKGWEMRPEPDALVERLAERDMLPAIYFVFSRKGCEEAMLTCAHLQLLREEELDRVEQYIQRYVEANPSVSGHPHLRYLLRGLGVHHAGLLPAWKVLVERLFQQGLVKVVFATETLAAGINMPARTTILSSITKRGDEGHRFLSASEFLQMSGRAGRRGMDRVGHVVVVASPFQTVADAQAIATAPPDPLGSHFTPTYGMVLNLLQRHTLEEAQFLVSRSFGEYLNELRRARQPNRRERREGRIRPSGVHSHNWQRFLALKDVLHQYHYLEHDHPTPSGVIASSFRAEHELLVVESLLSGTLDGLTPPEFGACMTALVAEELRRSAWVKVAPGQGVGAALRRVSRLAREMRIVEHRAGLDLGTRIHSDSSGLTQLWAEGAEWEQLLSFTNLDEGDVVRILRRTVDLLEQVQHAPMLDEQLKVLARETIEAMDREPVHEEL